MTQQQITEVVFRALHKAVVETPQNVKAAFRQAAQMTNEPEKTPLEKIPKTVKFYCKHNQ